MGVVTQPVACHDCDLLQSLGEIPEGARACCPRCGGLLRHRIPESLEHTLALASAAAVLFVVANTFPFLAFVMQGQVTQTTLMSGVFELWEQGMVELSVLVFATSVLAPLTQISLLLYVLLPLRWGRAPAHLALVFRVLRRVQPWSMMEVFMLGILVSVVKLAGMAEIVPGLALWSFALLIVVLAWAMASLDPEAVWERLEIRP